MELHPRTMAAALRDEAREFHRDRDRDTDRLRGLGYADGYSDALRMVAERLEQMADAEFERLLAEAREITHRFSRDTQEAIAPTDPTGIDCAEAYEGVTE